MLAAIAIVAVAAIVLVVATHSWWLAAVVSRQLSGTSGRAVQVESIRVGIDGSLRPVVRLRGVRIANAEWADARWPFADVEEAVAHVASWRSVVQGRPVISVLVLRNGRVDLERRADGTRNWRLRRPLDRGPGRYKVLALQAENSDLRFVHGGIDLVLEATARTAAADARNAAGAALPTQVALRGEWRGTPFTGDFATAAVLTFLETRELFPLRGHLEAGGTRFELDGRAGDIIRSPLLDSALEVRGQTLAVLGVFGSRRYANQPRRSFRLSGQARVDGRTYTLDRLRAKVGASDFAGTLVFDGAQTRARPGGLESAGSMPASGSARAERVSSAGSDANGRAGPAPRDTVRIDVASDLFDVADIEWLIGRPAARQVARAPPASTAASAPPRRPLDADIAVDAKRVRAAKAPWLDRARLRATSRDDVVTVSSFEAGVAGGVARGSATLDRSGDGIRGGIDATVTALRIETLLGEQDEKKRITGRVDLRARLESAGADADALLAAMTGRVDATLVDGSLSSLLDAAIGLQGFRMLRSYIGPARSVPVRCARVSLDVRKGSGRVRDLVLDTARTVTRGSGTVDFVGRTLDVTVTPEAKDAGVLVFDRSIRFHGPLAKPERDLVDRIAPPASTCGPK